MTKTVTINATPEKVWQALTEPASMQRWMGELEIDIVTTWQVGSPFIIRGAMYKKLFETLGTVLVFQPLQTLSYSHLSSLSRLADKRENYTVLHFELIPVETQTVLTLTASNFPTEIIYRHLAFYWNVALELLKCYVEAT